MATVKTQAKRTNLFFKGSVILFGFVNGLFMALGINPSAEVFAFLMPYVEVYGSNAVYFLTVLPTILLIISLYTIYRRAKWLGFFAVFLGFIGGLSIMGSWMLALGLLVVAWIIGYVAVK